MVTHRVDASTRSVKAGVLFPRTLTCRAGSLDPVDTLAARIRRAMAAKGWSTRELSRQAGFSSPSQVGNTLKRLDENPDAVELITLRRIAEALEVSVERLITGRDDLAVEALRSPRFRELHGWAQLETDARAIVQAPEWVWQTLREARPLLDGEPTAGDVADLALYVLRHGRRPQ